MVFEQITLKNFASYRGENTIDLLPKSPNKPIILIGGENGCGKTSLLDAFQLVLFGPAAQCSNRGKLSYDGYLERCINRDTALEDGSSIKLTFHFYLGGDKKHFNIERAWARKGKKIQEQFWVYQITSNGIRFEQSLSQNWADYVEGFFPSQVAPFFFFDGEKIEKLADFENSGQLVHAAIHSLLGLNTVDQLDIDLLALEKKKHKELASQEELFQIDKIESELSELKSRIKEASEKTLLLTVQRDIAQNQLKEVEIRFRLQGGDLYEKRSELEEQLHAGQHVIGQHEDNLRELAASGAPLILVKDLLNQIKIQADSEEHTRREEIICEMLVGRDQALIDNLTQHETASEITNHIKLYLEADREVRRKSSQAERYLNMHLDDIKTLNTVLDTEIPSLEQSIPIELSNLQNAREAVEVIQKSLSGVPDVDKISQILEERATALRHLEETTIALKEVSDDRERIKRQQDLKQSELKREMEKLESVRSESKDSFRMIQYSAKVRITLELFRKRIVESNMTKIESLVIKSFNRLLRKHLLVNSIEIDRETCEVKLLDSKNKHVLPERLSAGERQLLATALLWGISKAAEKQLPTIIDTPLGRLDTSHRTNLVRNYFPKASHQVLLLSTNEEIVGKYYEDLMPYVSHTCILDHNEINGGTVIKDGYFN